MDVPIIMQLESQQSFFETQIQFLDRMSDIPVVTQRQALTVQTVQKTRDSTVQRVAADVLVNCSSSSSPFQLCRKPSLAFKGMLHQSLWCKEADQTEECSQECEAPPLGRDEYDIPVELDEKPEACDDSVCDVSIKPPRKLERPHRAVSREWRDKKWG